MRLVWLRLCQDARRHQVVSERHDRVVVLVVGQRRRHERHYARLLKEDISEKMMAVMEPVARPKKGNQNGNHPTGSLLKAAASHSATMVSGRSAAW